MNINHSFQGIESQYWNHSSETKQNSLWASLYELAKDFFDLVKNGLVSVKPYLSRLFEVSCKVVGIAVTGMSVTIAKIQQLTTYISQINLTMINLAPQTTIYHHHAHHYHCSRHDVREENSRQSLGLVY